VVDKESGACSPSGTRYLLDQGWLHGDGVIVGEPGNSQITTVHRGLYRFRLQIHGEATHTGMQAWEQGTQGRNAILDMARVTVALAEISLPAVSTPAFARRRSMLTFPTLIKGGSGINVVPASCEAYGHARLLPEISAHEVRRVIGEQLERLSITAYCLDDLVSVPAAETDQEAEIVQTLAGAAETITGRRPPLQGCGPACDGWMFITRGILTVCGYGVTCGGAHGADEWVDLASLRSITEVYAHAMVHFLGSR